MNQELILWGVAQILNKCGDFNKAYFFQINMRYTFYKNGRPKIVLVCK